MRRPSGEFAFSGGRRTEDALKEVGDSMKEVFRGVEESFSSMKFTRPSWMGGGASSSTPKPAAKSDVPAAAPRGTADSTRQEATAPAANGAPGGEDDAAMRRHCAALERLVEIGLSPQAAKVALRHLDSWLVCEEGKAEMAAAEAEAFNCGEPILHVNDQVRLEGLVKNKGTNGKLGVLEAYGADSHRWKVRLADSQVFWIKPKLLRPLEMKRMPLPEPSSPEKTGDEQAQAAAQSKALAVAWAKLEARQLAWKEEQEAREIGLLEREEELRKLQEALEEEQVVLGERRQSIALEAKQPSLPAPLFDMAESPGSIETTHPPAVASFVADETSIRQVSNDEEEEEAEADEMWDMDWSALGGQGGQGSAAPGRGALQTLPSATPAVSSSSGAKLREPSAPSGSSLDEDLQVKLEDSMTVESAEFDKGSAPGVHPDIAVKLEERLHRLDSPEDGSSVAGTDLPDSAEPESGIN
eukprot:gb/GFBE01047404.1/.p1 GENE.gb/GFBE01047404.1/~~gb/GFBE01047404.1/.p1  ORF type:complete len:470 (+),score=118.87 gb/GFBE01047404.1/:1-1410(+)